MYLTQETQNSGIDRLRAITSQKENNLFSVKLHHLILMESCNEKKNHVILITLRFNIWNMYGKKISTALEKLI